ncbi:PaaX family transcriptional regulator [Nocardia carnea]|uniref:PaaX family transcriptional regulator n=1 Tax=Nocardia carnea TaxID=37328 RepID=UPI002456FC12|nr:PaaX family transcriptional regulator C-terminal domain-containing protein [Nocardia carnea]
MTHAEIVPNDLASSVKPQSVLFTVLGRYVLDRDMVVSTTSLIDVLASIGIGEHATRSTLNRMAKRGLLTRHRAGRNAYVALTPRLTEILRDGHIRIWRTGAVEANWDGSWTMLTFTFPESWQRQRHDLRARLQWAGFGSIQGGLWIAPAGADVREVLRGVEGADRVRVFRSRADAETDIPGMLHDAWDIAGISALYSDFIERWSDPERTRSHSVLGVQLLLVTEWLEVIRQDPRLPLEHLPAPWPAAPAQRLFHDLHDRLDAVARGEAAQRLDLRSPESLPRR